MDSIAVIIAWVATHISEITQIIGAFAIIATLTPNTSDDKIVEWILKAVNFAGGNIGKASNSSESKPE